MNDDKINEVLNCIFSKLYKDDRVLSFKIVDNNKIMDNGKYRI